MKTYSIKDLEKYSGIKAHTIRIWEQRYQLLSPDRNEGNRRLYSEEEFKSFLVISSLYNIGYKPKEIKNLSESERKKALSQKVNNKEIDHIISLVEQYDFTGLSLYLDELFTKKGLKETYFDLIIPLLFEIGKLWSIDKLNIAQEHLFSCALRNQIIQRTTNTSVDTTSKNYSKKILLFQPENEFHEIPILLIHALLKKENYDVVYLGQDVPTECLKDVSNHKFDRVFFYVVNFKNNTENLEYIKYISELFKDSTVLSNIDLGSFSPKNYQQITTKNIV